jgi:hypothetical protein
MASTIRVIAAPAEGSVETKGLLTEGAEAVVANVDLAGTQAESSQVDQGHRRSACRSAQLRRSAHQASDRRRRDLGQRRVTLVGTLTAGAKAAISLTFERE